MSDLNLFNLDEPVSIAIPLRFGGIQPNAYGVEEACVQTYKTEKIIGDTRLGGSCNFSQVKLIPQCNGTHTECVGHITHERIHVHECLKDALMLAFLISVEPMSAAETTDSYAVPLEKGDKIITRDKIKIALEKLEKLFDQINENTKFPTALIIRTLPNDEGKLTQKYVDSTSAPFLSTEAMNLIVQRNFNHILVDTPSLDRLYDEGKLSNHRVFWQVERDSCEITKDTRLNHTITELIYVPNDLEDDIYLLNLQIAPFNLESSPSRPILFKRLDNSSTSLRSLYS